MGTYDTLKKTILTLRISVRISDWKEIRSYPSAKIFSGVVNRILGATVPLHRSHSCSNVLQGPLEGTFSYQISREICLFGKYERSGFQGLFIAVTSIGAHCANCVGHVTILCIKRVREDDHSYCLLFINGTTSGHFYSWSLQANSMMP